MSMTAWFEVITDIKALEFCAASSLRHPVLRKGGSRKSECGMLQKEYGILQKEREQMALYLLSILLAGLRKSINAKTKSTFL